MSIKRAYPNVSLTSNVEAFGLLFGRRPLQSSDSPTLGLLSGRKPCTLLDSLMPMSGNAGQSGGLGNFVQLFKQNFQEVHIAFEMW